MTKASHREGLQIQSTITKDGRLELTLATVESPALGDGDILIRVEASPLNPSDLGLLFGPADMTKASASKDAAGRPVVTAPVPPGLMKMVQARIDQSLPVGNEGAGIVVAAGASEAAQALIGKTVSAVGGGMYSQFRAAPAAMCLPMPEGTTAREAASWFVNPLTALGMVETMRKEGHKALVHTAAASNLGQMLNKICLADGIPLVNIVRKPEQEEILKKIGAKHICNSSVPDFRDRLVDALVETGATLAFDATRGGKLVGQILSSMEIALNRNAKEYSRYGSSTHKQAYIYGRLDPSPTELVGDFGMAWGIGGWLLPPFLQHAGGEVVARMRARVAAEITTTFASHYTAEISLAQALEIETIKGYGRQATGEKYLINPQLG